MGTKNKSILVQIDEETAQIVQMLQNSLTSELAEKMSDVGRNIVVISDNLEEIATVKNQVFSLTGKLDDLKYDVESIADGTDKTGRDMQAILSAEEQLKKTTMELGQLLTATLQSVRNVQNDLSEIGGIRSDVQTLIKTAASLSENKASQKQEIEMLLKKESEESSQLLTATLRAVHNVQNSLTGIEEIRSDVQTLIKTAASLSEKNTSQKQEIEMFLKRESEESGQLLTETLRSVYSVQNDLSKIQEVQSAIETLIKTVAALGVENASQKQEIEMLLKKESEEAGQLLTTMLQSVRNIQNDLSEIGEIRSGVQSLIKTVVSLSEENVSQKQEIEILHKEMDMLRVSINESNMQYTALSSQIARLIELQEMQTVKTDEMQTQITRELAQTKELITTKRTLFGGIKK